MTYTVLHVVITALETNNMEKRRLWWGGKEVYYFKESVLGRLV